MGKYFTVRVTPDVINGDVSTVVGNTVGADSGDAPFVSKDILFDWTAFDIPKGAARLVSVVAYVMGEDGGEQTDTDINLVFATAKTGEAPTSLGAVNSAQTAGFDLPDHILGGFKLEGTTEGQGAIQGPAFGNVYINSSTSANGATGQTLILEGDPTTGTNVGFDKIYVAGFAGGQIDFSTGVKPDAQATTSTATISVDGTDARKCFQVGDTVYTNTDDTPLGTVKSLTDTSIVLNANLAAQVEDNEEIVNANPIKLVLGFER